MSQGRRFVRHKAVQLPHLSTASLNGLNISLCMLNSTQSGTLSLVNTHRLGKNEKKRMSYLEQHERCTADSSKSDECMDSNGLKICGDIDGFTVADAKNVLNRFKKNSNRLRWTGMVSIRKLP